MMRLLLLVLLSLSASGCVVTNLTTGERYECGVYLDDHMIHCVPIGSNGIFKP